MAHWGDIHSKCLKVINSCETQEQFELAKRYQKLAEKQIDKAINDSPVDWVLRIKLKSDFTQAANAKWNDFEKRLLV